MADSEVTVKISADDKASGVLKGLQGALSGVGNVAGTVFKAGLFAGAAGIAALGVGLVSSIKDAAGFEKELSGLDSVLKSTKGAAGITRDEILKLAGNFQKTTEYSDDMIVSASKVMLTFTSIGKDVFPQAITAAADLSAVMGQDLQSSVVQIGKALNDPIQGMSALARVGVSFTEQQKAQIKTMQESGNLMGAQNIILQELQKEFGGAAQAAGGTFAGQLTILNNALADAGKTVGAAFIPALTVGVQWLNTTAIPAVTNFATGIAGIVTALSNVAQSGDWSAVAGAFAKVMPSDWALYVTQIIANFADALKSGDWQPVIDAFWSWADQALIDSGVKLSTLINSLAEELKSPEQLATINLAGQDLGKSMVDGLLSIFNPSSEDMSNMGAGLGASLVNLGEGLQANAESFGRGLATGIARGIWQKLTGRDLSEQMLGMLNGLFDSIIAGSKWVNPISAIQNLSLSRAGIPGFATGGMVPGMLGQPQLAVVHGGETVIPVGGGMGGGMGGGLAVTVVYAPTVSLASRSEAQNILQPFIEQGILNARLRQIGATG